MIYQQRKGLTGTKTVEKTETSEEYKSPSTKLLESSPALSCILRLDQLPSDYETKLDWR